MIEKLCGKYVERTPTGIILDVGGVGYGITMTLSDMCALTSRGDTLSLWIYTYLREDTLKLFGFFRQDARRMFEILLGLNGIGPKVAIAILSTLKIETIKQAVMQQQSAIFEVVPGVGSRLAEKILIELKSKISKFNEFNVHSDRAAASSQYAPTDFVELRPLQETIFDKESPVLDQQLFFDLESALENLGFKQKLIASTVSKLKNEDSIGKSFQELLRSALKNLTASGNSEILG
jgi:Holliday junction DNA helicase RuvA